MLIILKHVKLNVLTKKKKNLLKSNKVWIKRQLTKHKLFFYSNFISTYLSVFEITTFIFFNKLVLGLLKNGKKEFIEKIFLFFLSYFKYKYRILNIFLILKYLLYLNLVPVINPIRIGFKKQIIRGKLISISSRISKTYKLFIKGINQRNGNLINKLFCEFINLLLKQSLLHSSNQVVLNEIKQYNLVRYFNFKSQRKKKQLKLKKK